VTVSRSAVTLRRGPEASAPENRVASNVPSARSVVFTVHDGVARQWPVETGLRTDVLVEIRSGLQPGGEVMAGPADAVHRRLSDGDAVAVHEALPVGSAKE